MLGGIDVLKVIIIILCIWIGGSIYIHRNEIDWAPFKKDFQLLGEWIIDRFKK